MEVVYHNIVRPSRSRSPLGLMLVAIVAFAVCGAVLLSALPSTDTHVVVDAAYIEFGGERITRVRRTFVDVPDSDIERLKSIAIEYQEISHTLVRVALRLQEGTTSTAAASALVRNLEATTLSSLGALGTLSESSMQESYSASYMYAAIRLEEISHAPTVETLWMTARELFVR